MRTEQLGPHDVIINADRLIELRIHEARYAALQSTLEVMNLRMLKRSRWAGETGRESRERAYHLGWIDAWKEYQSLYLAALDRQFDMHPELVNGPPPNHRIRKGQLCIVNEPGCDCLRALRDPLSSYDPVPQGPEQAGKSEHDSLPF